MKTLRTKVLGAMGALARPAAPSSGGRIVKASALVTGALALGLLAGCGHGATSYAPQLRAYGELTLKYDDGFSMYAEGREIASGHGWSGLSEYVKCVPKAKEHAESAETAGAAASALSWIGAGVGLASLGSLAAVADYEKHEETSNMVLGLGLTAAVTGVILAAIGRHEKPVANGHAIDAMNYYNDEVGSRGGTCKRPAAPLPEVEAPKPAKTEKKAPDDKKSPDDKLEKLLDEQRKPDDERKPTTPTTPKVDI